MVILSLSISIRNVLSSNLSGKSLSVLIKKARDKHDLTQTAFGKLFEPSVAQPTIARWEKGDLLPNRKHFPKIANLLNITLEEFLDLVGHQLRMEGIVLSLSDDEIYVPNQRHFNVLSRGIKSWNRWRAKNHRITPQLAGAKPQDNYLDEIDLSRSDLKGAFLHQKSLRDANLSGADLKGADLSQANLSGADLRDANLAGANLTQANLSNAYLFCANLSGADLTQANLSNAYLFCANLSEAILVNSILCEANLKKANLSNADLTSADLREANFNQANLEYAVLKYCYIYGVSTWNSNLQQAIQKKLSICPDKIQPIYVDCIENIHLKFLEIHNYNNIKISELAKALQNLVNESKTTSTRK